VRAYKSLTVNLESWKYYEDYLKWRDEGQWGSTFHAFIVYSGRIYNYGVSAIKIDMRNGPKIRICLDGDTGTAIPSREAIMLFTVVRGAIVVTDFLMYEYTKGGQGCVLTRLHEEELNIKIPV